MRTFLWIVVTVLVVGVVLWRSNDSYCSQIDKELQGEWNLNATELEDACYRLEQDFPSIPKAFLVPFLFSYSKNVHGKKTAQFRQMEFSFLIDPSSQTNPATQKQYQKAWGNLERLVATGGGDKATNNPAEFAGDEFGIALKKLPPAWSSSNRSFIFFRDSFPPNSDVLVQRYQRSGLCYMHAPVVLQHYAVSKTKGSGDGVQMIDIRKHILHNFTADQLEDHIFRHHGGSSKTFLESILEPGSLLKAVDASDGKQVHLEKYGPALVAQFKVYDDFYGTGNYVYKQKPSGVYRGRHSMVLVGVREENGQKFFLLQNWWKEKQFVEVSVDYMKQTASTLYFIETPQDEIPKGLDLASSHFAETEAVDLAEQLDCEMSRL